jgi:hypothetical protein
MARRSPPKQDQNAAKRDFYAKALDEAERMELEEAASIEGLNNEIAILRLKLRQLLEQYPERVDLQMRAANTLARLIRTRYNITAEEKKNLREAITTVLKDVALPLGIKFLP